MVKPECLPPKIRNKARMSTLTTAIQGHTGSPGQCNKAIQRIKGSTDWNGRNKTLFSDIISYIKNIKKLTKKHLSLTSITVMKYEVKNA